MKAESRDAYGPKDFPDRIPIVIDTDAANEIDDLYAIALALAADHRFEIRGFVATHFAAVAGRESIQRSYDVLVELLSVAGARYPVAKGGDPLIYPGEPQASAGSDFIIEEALRATPDEPVLVLGLGAASNISSAMMREPRIRDRIVVMFHGRSEATWPHATAQFNIVGDVIAAQYLLESDVRLIWFNTGTHLCASMEETERRLLPLGEIGRYLHEYRYQSAGFQSDRKGFFDLGDTAWLIEPGLCSYGPHPVPELKRPLTFDFSNSSREMLLVSSIRPEPTWDLFYSYLSHAFVEVGHRTAAEDT